MKKITLLFALLISTAGFSQTIPVTFEAGITSGAITGNPGVITPADANWYSDSGLASASVEDLDSDSPDHLNAGKIVSSSTGQVYQNAQLLLNDNYIDLTTSNKTITLDVYSNSPQDFLLKIEGNLETDVVTQKGFSHAGSGWETISVDFSNPDTDQPVPDDQYRRLVIFPGWHIAASGFKPAFESTTYVDNITRVVGVAYVPPAPPADPTTNAPTPPSRKDADVFSIYSDSYANVTGANYNPDWGQSGFNNVEVGYNPTGVTTENEINTVIAYTNFNYQGIEFTAQDLSDMEYLHIDVYSNTPGAVLKVFPIRNGDGTGPEDFAVDVPLVYNGWSSVDLPKGDFTSLTWDSLYQLKLDCNGGTKPSDIYVDNIYFWKAPTDVLTDASLSDLTVDGSTVTGFSSQTLSYDVELPVGTTVVPTVVGTPTQTSASAAATNATQLPGASTVVVTAEDGTTQQTYTINFTVSTGLSDYCDTEVTHFMIAAETASAINLTIVNTGTSTMKVTASDDQIDLLQIDSGTTGNPTLSTADTSVTGEISITLTWAAGTEPNGDVTFGNILWSKTTLSGNWMVNAGNISSPFTGVCATAGIEDISANAVKMYPNPAKGVVNFSSASNDALTVSVFDILGKQVMDAQNVQSQLNISSLNPGMYFVKMTQGSNSATKKLVVK